MKNNNSSEDEKIRRKYDFRLNAINAIESIGIIAGYGSALTKMVYNIVTSPDPTIMDAGIIGGGFLLGTLSVVIGDYFYDKSKKKMETAENNLEKTLQQ